MEVVRRYFEAYDRGDIDAGQSLFAPKVEFTPSGRPDGPLQREVEDIARTIIEFLGSFASQLFTGLSMTWAIRWWSSFMAALERSTLCRCEDRFAELFSLRDGRILDGLHRRLHDALEAAGLSGAAAALLTKSGYPLCMGKQRFAGRTSRSVCRLWLSDDHNREHDCDKRNRSSALVQHQRVVEAHSCGAAGVSESGANGFERTHQVGGHHS